MEPNDDFEKNSQNVPPFVLAWCVVAIVVVIFIVAFCSPPAIQNKDTQTEANQAYAPTHPPVKITAVQLKKEYDANEVATDEKYKGVVLRIAGVISSVDKDFQNNMVLRISDDDNDGYASMTMRDDQKNVVIGLQKGEAVSVECQKVMRLIGDPSGSGCLVILPISTDKQSDGYTASQDAAIP